MTGLFAFVEHLRGSNIVNMSNHTHFNMGASKYMEIVLGTQPLVFVFVFIFTRVEKRGSG